MFRVQDSGFRFRVSGLGFKVFGFLGFPPCGAPVARRVAPAVKFVRIC